MKIKYNAPVTLTFSLLTAGLLLFLEATGGTDPQRNSWVSLFAAPAAGTFRPDNLIDYLRLFTHALGHSGWDHLLGNLTFILLLGPMLEEKYNSRSLIFMMVVTSLFTGILNAVFLSTGLMGASGIVFMMILLASFTNIKAGEIPLTFFAVAALFLGKEVLNAFQQNDISEFAHIIGGIIGSLFGLLAPALSAKAKIVQE